MKSSSGLTFTKKALKYIAFFLLSVLIIANLILWYWGGSTIIITAIFYALIYLVCRGLTSIIFLNPEKRANFRLAITTLVVGLFIVELILKYVVGTYDYNFHVPQTELLGRKMNHKADLRLDNYPPTGQKPPLILTATNITILTPTIL